MSFNKNFILVFSFFLLLILFVTKYSCNAEEFDTSLTKRQYNQGLFYLDNLKYDSALFYYNLAKNRFQKEKNWLYYVKSLIEIGKVYLNQNQIEKSNEYFDLADKTAKIHVYNNLEIKEDNKVYVKYTLAYMQSRYDMAVEYAEQFLKFDLPDNEVLSIYNISGYCYFYLQDYENSKKAYFNAVKILEKDNKKNIILLGSIYNLIATDYYFLSEYDNAILYHKKAVRCLENNINAYSELTRSYTGLSIVHYAQENFNKAVNCLNLALGYSTKNYLKSSIYRSLGCCFEKMDDFAQSEKSFKKALYYSENDINKNDEKIIISLYYGDLCKRQNNRDKALKLYNQAVLLSLYDKGLKNYLTSKCYTFLADFYTGEKDYNKAFQNYQSALISLNSLFYSTDIYTNPSSGKIFSYSQYFKILKNKADAFLGFYKLSRQQKDLEMGLETYELLCNEMEQQRSGFMTKDDKSFITEKYYGIYSAALQTAMQLYKIAHNPGYKERALKLAEQNKSAFLLEKFNENNAKNFAGVPQYIREKEKTIKREIANCEKMIYDESLKIKRNPKTKTYWESCLFDARKANDTLSAYIKNNFAGYHRLKYDPSGISSSEIQKKLSSETALVEYFLSDTVLYIFIITKEKFEIIEQKPISDMELEKFNQCFDILKIERGGNKFFKDYTQAAFRLYQKLLKPAEPIIKLKNELIIIPDDKLALIPFEALISTEKISGISYKNLSYLIKKFNIGYIQLATLFVEPKIYLSHNPKILAIVPDYGTSIFKMQKEIQKLQSGGYKLNPIIGATKEVKYLQEIEGTKIFYAGEATEGAFKKSQRRYNIIHLAMHAVIDYKNPMYSKLIFSRSDEVGEDGFLNLYELMNMEVGANLVVLSACNSGTGNFLKGEGIMNLARGFFYAGCESVIMTLWAVDDNPSSELIKKFYYYFTKGKSKTEALRFAKLNYLEHSKNIKAHPYFWAGYINIGDASPLYSDISKKIKIIVIGAIFLTLAIIIFIVIKLINQRKQLTLNKNHKL